MQWHDFVFSEKPSHRLLRHSIFWFGWWIYFSVCFYLHQQPAPYQQPYYVTVGSHILIKTFLLILIDAVAVYTSIYLILPQLIKSRWVKAFATILLLVFFLFVAGYLMFWEILPFVDSLFGSYKPHHFFTKFWPAVSLGLIDPLKVVATAAIIKYAKYWVLKKKEGEKLEMEKINAELQLLKAQIHPGFLFHSLNNIYAYSLTASPKAPEMLLKLSDLLSYMLYECDEPFVLLEKEVKMMKDYIALEKIRLDDNVDMELNVQGDMNGKMIAPFLLLPFIENSFKQSSTLTEQAWMNMDISIKGDSFTLKLANGIKVDNNTLYASSEKNLSNVKKRLTLIYPQRHELKISLQREMLLVLLKIQLAETAAIPSVEYEEALTT